MNGMKRSTVAASLASVALMVVTATVGAATIRGTAGNDTLRGGAKADRLDGKGGNDKLYGAAGSDVLLGGAGNDLLVGGPGADKLTCGPGQDTARGDAQDRIGADCEIVKGVPSTAPPSTPPTSTAPAPGLACHSRLLPGHDAERKLRVPDGLGEQKLHRTPSQRPPGNLQRWSHADRRRGLRRQHVPDQGRRDLRGCRETGTARTLRAMRNGRTGTARSPDGSKRRHP